MAGIQQGDELLSIDGVPLGGQSPFQAASLLQARSHMLNVICLTQLLRLLISTERAQIRMYLDKRYSASLGGDFKVRLPTSK